MFWQVHVILELDEILAELGHKVIDWEILLTIQLRQLEMMQTLQNIGFREDDYQKDNFLLKDPIRPFWSILQENIWRNISILKGFWTIQSWNKRTFKDFSAADTFISRKILKSFQMTFFFIIVEISGFFFCYFLIFYVKSISENLLRCSKPELWFHVKSEWQIFNFHIVHEGFIFVSKILFVGMYFECKIT